MTIVDLTRTCSAGAPPGGLDLGDLIEGDDSNECPTCVAAGGVCEFHRGWAEGWDAHAALVARRVQEHLDAGGTQ
jgi:hypothetical protein